jgi:hypothetical protein
MPLDPTCGGCQKVEKASLGIEVYVLAPEELRCRIFVLVAP